MATAPAQRPSSHEQVQQKVLVVEIDLPLDALLVERLQDHVAGAVGAIAGAAHGGLAALARVAAEGALGDPAVGRAAEGQPPVLQFVDRFDGLAAQNLGGVLVGQIVQPFTVSNMCHCQWSSSRLPRAAPIPPCAAPVCERAG